MQKTYLFLIETINYWTDDVNITCLILILLLFLLIYLIFICIALNIERIIFSLLSISFILTMYFDRLICYIAKNIYSEDNYITFYNNHLKKRGILIRCCSYSEVFNRFRFHSNEKLDLYSIFLFIYTEVAYGALKHFFMGKNNLDRPIYKFQIEIVYNLKDQSNRTFTIFYDFYFEKLYNDYKNTKLINFYILFNKKEGIFILKNFSSVDIYLSISDNIN